MTNEKHPTQRRYPPELKERGVRMVWEAMEENGGVRAGVIPRVAHQLGVGVESLRGWVNQAEIDRGSGPGRPVTSGGGSPSSSARSGSCGGPTRSSRRPRLFSRGSSTRDCRSSGVHRPAQHRGLTGWSRESSRSARCCSSPRPRYYAAKCRPPSARALERRRARSRAASGVRGELRGVRGGEAVAATPPRGCHGGPRPGGPADARAGHRRGGPGQAEAHHDPRRGGRPARRPGQAPVHGRRPRTACGSPISTYVRTWSGFRYVAFIIDAFSRRIVGWRSRRRCAPTWPSTPWRWPSGPGPAPRPRPAWSITPIMPRISLSRGIVTWACAGEVC